MSRALPKLLTQSSVLASALVTLLLFVSPGAAKAQATQTPKVSGTEVEVTTTRTEQRLGAMPASVSVLGGNEIRESPALTADDMLRRIPTFATFRRTSSLAAHPTNQGVSLRGIANSAASRTLVLVDGVPFNDPFGGWVYWTRVPMMNLDRIEVVDSATSSLYGNYAMGGVINLTTSRPTKRTFMLQSQGGMFRNILDPQFGNLYSTKTDFFASDVWGKLGVAIEGTTSDSDGYPVIASTQRGPVDTKADVDYRNFNIKLNYDATQNVNVFFRGGRLNENRSNAKTTSTTNPGIPETNDTRWVFASGGVKVRLPDGSDLEGRVFTDFEEFHSNFLSVPDNLTTRALARQTTTQRVPVKGFGTMTQWSKKVADKHFVTVGWDWRWVDGDSSEVAFDGTVGTRPILTRLSGGTQQITGGFIQDLIEVTPELTVTLSARLDHWRNYGASKDETDIDTTDATLPEDLIFVDKENTVGSPHAAVLYRLTNRVTTWAGVSWGFRAPTLNELYRQFSVAGTVTRSNDALGPERLFGWESGVNVALMEDLTWRTTVFDDRFTHAVTNVTIGTNLQQRQNVGKTHVWGLQSDIEYRLASNWRASAAYVYDVARVQEFSTNPALVGRNLQQVPRNRGSFEMAYTNPKYVDASAQYRYIGAQYDDDVNTPTRRLGGFGVVDLLVSRDIYKEFEVFVGVQNIANREFLVQTNPRTVGAPRLVNVGFRVHLTGS